MNFSIFDPEFENWKVPAIETLFGVNSELRPFERDIRKRYISYKVENKKQNTLTSSFVAIACFKTNRSQLVTGLDERSVTVFV